MAGSRKSFLQKSVYEYIRRHNKITMEESKMKMDGKCWYCDGVGMVKTATDEFDAYWDRYDSTGLTSDAIVASYEAHTGQPAYIEVACPYCNKFS